MCCDSHTHMLVIWSSRVTNLCFSSCSAFKKDLGAHLTHLCEWMNGDLHAHIQSVTLPIAAWERQCPHCTGATTCPEFCYTDSSNVSDVANSNSHGEQRPSCGSTHALCL